MATRFIEIYDDFLSKIDDSDLLSLSNDEINEFLSIYLQGAIAYFKKCRKDLEDNIDYETQSFNVDLDFEEIDILSDAMVLRWVKPQVARLDKFRTSLGDRDFKMSSNAKQLEVLLSLQKDIREDLKKKIMSYRYNELSEILNNR